jgi:hypothetical protein
MNLNSTVWLSLKFITTKYTNLFYKFVYFVVLKRITFKRKTIPMYNLKQYFKPKKNSQFGDRKFFFGLLVFVLEINPEYLLLQYCQ